ncbi:unnamed protein product [Prorocentrum cordatum]|uniref:Uncharacterized protein n=1 Tax=Prorocentrum cordatum TaxID=2364126 RepID=A0ABN9PN19_9DINO|nr:unnamed protein product [Polarella glacialis]
MHAASDAGASMAEKQLCQNGEIPMQPLYLAMVAVVVLLLVLRICRASAPGLFPRVGDTIGRISYAAGLLLRPPPASFFFLVCFVLIESTWLLMKDRGEICRFQPCAH